MATKTDNINLKFKAFLTNRRQRAENLLEKYLSVIADGGPKKLDRAMQYVVLGKGKRLRPLLVYAVGKAYGANIRLLDAPAAAIEMVHAFSLVHDDLPAMDDDVLRRGKPTCHIAFDESTAILVGDVLAIGAFQILSEATVLSVEKRIMMSRVLAKASGPLGMAGGQYLDLHETRNKISKNNLVHMYRLKTGALLEVAIRLGSIAAGVSDIKELRLLEELGFSLGLAFQIKDDVLNIESSVTRLGKNVGTDRIRNKVTYPVLVGVVEAKAEVERLLERAEQILCQLKTKNSVLSALIKYIVHRDF